MIFKRIGLILLFTIVWIFMFLPASTFRAGLYGTESYRGYAWIGDVMVIIYIVGIVAILKFTKKKAIQVLGEEKPNIDVGEINCDAENLVKNESNQKLSEIINGE